MPKNSKFSVLTENLHAWYLRRADSESALRFLKSRPHNPLLGEFGPKKSNLSILPKNWHIRDLDDAGSYSDISFPNFESQIHFWANLGQKVTVVRLA